MMLARDPARCSATVATVFGVLQCPIDAPVSRWIDTIGQPVGTGHYFPLCEDHAAMHDGEERGDPPR